MAKKNKETVNANNLRSEHFAEFEANHQFNIGTKLAEFTRAAITAGLTNDEIVEIGESIYGEGRVKVNCINWYRSSDPVLNPGKERYKATGARMVEVKNKALDMYATLSDEDKADFMLKLSNKLGIEQLIKCAKVEVLKEILPEDLLAILFPVKVAKPKKGLTEVEKLMKKQEAAEKKAAKLKEELAALQEKAENAEAPADGQ